MKVKYLIPSAFSIFGLTLSCIVILMILANPSLKAHPHIVTLIGQLFVLALLVDGLDGVSARLLRAESNFGSFLDTYMDFFTYSVIPAAVVVELFGHTFFNYFLLVYIIVMGACRMSKFHTNRMETGPRAFMGLPITLNALWIILAAFLMYGNSTLHGFFELHYSVVYYVVVICIIIFCVLQLLDIEYPKPTKNPIILLLSALFTAISFTSFIYAKTYLAFFIMLYILYFVLTGLFGWAFCSRHE